MKLKKRRASEVPPKIKDFINSVITAPFESIEEPLKNFVWDFDKGDFHHWVDLFNHFDAYFEKYIKPRRDLQLEDDFLNSDPPFPKAAALQILRVVRCILENCTNKHFYSSYEQHLSSLLASTDADVVEASLQTLASFLKKTLGKYSIRDAALNSKLFAFAQGWGGKEEGLGLTACAVENVSDSIAYQLGCALHFEFYAVDESSSESSSGLQIIHLPNVNCCVEPDLELLQKLVKQHKVPANLRFQLLTRLRFARAFGSLSSRHQYTCIRLYAFVVLVQASTETNDLVSFLNSEPEFINELVSLLSFEEDVPEKVRILSLLSLVALCQDRSRQPTVLAAVTSGGHRGILSSLMQKSIDSVLNQSSKWSVIFSEALLSLVTVLVSSSSGCSAMREAGFIPTLLPLLKDTDPQHLHLVSTAVHVLEAFMDYSNPAAALFRDLGGLDDTISRLKEEVSAMENVSKKLCDDSSGSSNRVNEIAGTSALDDVQPLYSEAMVAYHRRLLLKALLRAISLGTYAPGNTTHIYSSEESLLPHCLCVIFRKAKDFGGGVFSLAATVTSDLIHKDPTSFSVLDAAGLPSAFMDAIMDCVPCSAEAITCIPQCLDALCLNNSGIQAVKDRNALSCFVKIFTSKPYLRALSGDTPASLSTGLDELMRHASALRVPGVEMLIEILNTIGKIGSGSGADASSSSADSLPSTSVVPMETDAEEKSVSPVEGEILRVESIDAAEVSSDASSAHVETFLPDLVINVARLLETILQNADMCRIFVEKKGIDAVLQIFTLPLLPPSISVGQSISFAFKNFSHQHSASLARTVCPFLKEHLVRTNELLNSVRGTLLVQLESAKQTKLLKCLSSLEGILALSISLLKGTAPVVSELGAGDADVLKDLGRTYREVLWQISLICDSKVDEKPSVDTENISTSASSVTGIGRESDDDSGLPVLRFMNPLSIRNAGSQSQWSGERDFISMIRSGEGLSRRSRHNGMTRIRGGRTGRHMDAINIDTDNMSCVPESSSSQELRKISPDVLVSEILEKLASTMRSFFAALVKGFTSPNRRRADSAPLSLAAKNIGAALAKVYLEALSFSGHPTAAGAETLLSVKCRYLGKVVDDMSAVTFDNRRRLCYASIVNNLYVCGAFKELLTTFEATSQLLWNLPPYSVLSSNTVDSEKRSEGNNKLVQYSWLFDTLQSYCRVLECFVNSSLLLSPSSSSHSQLLIQPAAVGLSIGLFPVPRDAEVFVRTLQTQVLDVIFPVWNHPMFPSCTPSFLTSILSLVTYIYSGVGDIKHNRGPTAVNVNQRVAPPPDETTVSAIVEMGFSRARVEEALRRVGSNSIEMAMEWLCNHAEDPVQEDDELARALALSLGSSTETSKAESTEKSIEVSNEEGKLKPLPVDDILATLMKLVQSGGDSMAFALTDLLVTLSTRNKGQDRLKVTSYLVQQLKVCPFDFEKDSSLAATISHVLALLLSEDTDAREVAAQNGLIPVAIDILSNFKSKNATGGEIISTRCVSAALLIVDRLLQARPRVTRERSSEATSAVSSGPSPAEGNASLTIPEPTKEKKMSSDYHKDEFSYAFAEVLGKSTGYLSIEESHSMLSIACDLLKQYVPAVVMQAVLQLCARLTKTHSLALHFLENGGLTYLFNLPRNCFFPGYDTLASAIVRHLLEDPHTLQTAMESEIRQVLSGSRHSGRVASRTFLTSMAPMISRDPVVFMKAASAICQLETSGGRNIVVLSKDKEKDKDRSKAETGLLSNDPLKIPEMRLGDGPGKSPRSHKKIPSNLTQVLDQLLEIVFQFPSPKGQEDCVNSSTSMEVDDTATKVKGKSKIDETKKIEIESFSEKSALLAKVTFVLKLLSEILLMYSPAVGAILRRDSELCQLKGSCQIDALGHGGIVHHVLQRVLPVSVDEPGGPNELREKLAEKASFFLVVLCGRSSEGRRRVISELVKALSMYSTVEGNSLKTRLLPDQKVLAFAELVYCILSKNSPSSNLPVSGYSPDIAKSMIDGGTIPCLTNILQAIDLDHPDAPKVSNLILKALEVLTRAANSSHDQASRADASNKRRTLCSQGRSEDQVAVASTAAVVELNQARATGQEGVDLEDNVSRRHLEEAQHTQNSSDGDGNQDGPLEQDTNDNEGGEDMTIDRAANPPIETGSGFTQDDEMDDGGMLPTGNQLHVNYHVENRTEDDIVDEDDDMGDEGDEEDDEDEVEEDEDIAEDGAAFMSLADTDADDHEDVGLGDEYNDELVDEEDDEFHENRVIEVRWREALGGFGHLQVLGQSGSSLIDASSDTFEGVNVDDLFGLRRSLGFERRRQTNNRSSLDRTNTGTSVQHPLLSRPSTGVGSTWASTVNSSRASELFQGEQFDVTQFYIFDAPLLPSDHTSSGLYGGLSAGLVPPPLTDYSSGVDSLHLSGRRVAGDGRWADDGQPQAGSQASSVAEAVEDLFVSVLRSSGGDDEVANAQNSREQVKQLEVQENQDGVSEQERHESGSEHREEYTEEDASHERVNPAHPPIDNLGRSLRGDDIVSSNVDVTDSISNGQPIIDIGDDNGVLNPHMANLPDLAVPSGGHHYTASTGEHSQVTAEPQDVPMQPIGGCGSVEMCTDLTNQLPVDSSLALPSQDDGHPSVIAGVDLDMSGANVEPLLAEHVVPLHDIASTGVPSTGQPASVAVEANHTEQNAMEDDGPASSGIDPTFLEALPDDLRAEVLASQQSQPVQPPAYNPPSVEDIDPEFLAALPPEIQAEVLAQQRAQRVTAQAVGQPVEMDNASIIATLPADLREEVLLTSSEAVIAELPSPLQAEAQMLRDRTMSHYQAHSLIGSRHRLTSRRNGLGFGQNSLMNRGVGVTIGRRLSTSLGDGLKEKEIEGEPLLDPDSLNALIRLLRLAQPLSKGLLQRLMLNLCAHSVTRATLVRLLLNMIKPEADGMAGSITTANAHRLYGCPSNVVYGRSQLLNGLPPLVLRRVLEALTYLAANHSAVANILFYFDPSLLSDSSSPKLLGPGNGKGKEKIKNDETIANALGTSLEDGIPFVLFLRLLNQPLFICSAVHLEQVMGLLQVIVCTAASKLEHLSIQDQIIANAQEKSNKPSSDSEQKDVPSGTEPSNLDKDASDKPVSQCEEETKGIEGQSSSSSGKRGNNIYDIFLQLPESDLSNLSRILGHEGLSDKVYALAGDVLKKLASVVPQHRKFFALELSGCAEDLCRAAVSELNTMKSTNMAGLSAGSRAGIAVLRVLRALSSLTSSSDGNSEGAETETEEQEDEAILRKLNGSLEPLWEELSECISMAETLLGQSNLTPASATSLNVWDNIHRVSSSSPSVPPGTQRLLPFIEAFFVLCEKLQSNSSLLQQDHANITAIEVKESGGSGPPLSPVKYSSGEPHRKPDGVVTFARFAEKHRRLLNVFIRQNTGLLEKSLSMMLKAPRFIDFDNKKAHFRSRIRQQHEQHLTGPLRISVRRAYVLEDSYNQLRMRSTHDLKGRLNVHFQGEEGIDAGGLTREWYQLLSRVIFDKGALLFTTVGNNATFQPNPNSVYQTEHLSYFKFVGRVVAKALFDGQLLDVYFTRSFYKHILGVKVTYHDIEAVDPDYYKNLKWMLENDVSDIPDLTFSMDADEEKHILYEKTEVTDFELKLGGRNIRVTEETKHEYVDLVADHILTNAIRPQITSFLEGFNELVPRELISIFNDKELELLISGLPEIDLDDLKANTEYTGYTTTSNVVQWFWEVVGSFSKEDMARFLQFVTGTSKVPLEGFRALQGISGPQRFQIHKAYGAPERLPSAHTCFNQLDLPEYPSMEQLKDRLLLAIHEASEGFGFG